MSNKSPFGSASHFANIGSWKAGSHTSNSLLLKAQSRQLNHWFAAVTKHNWEHNHCIVTNLGDHNSMTTPSVSVHGTVFFFELQWRDGHDAVASGREWMLWIPKRNGRNRFLRQTCPTNLFSAVRHIVGTSAAEGLAAPLPTHCC